MGLLDKAKSTVRRMTDSATEEVIGESVDDVRNHVKKTSRSSVESSEESAFERLNITADVFEADDEEFLNSGIFNHQETAEEKYSKARDVLEQLGIAETYVIPNDVYVSSDLDDVSFNHSAPVGYDFGEVDGFILDMKSSLDAYVKMLDKRNHDITELALYVDRVQAENRNILYQSEMASGVNVIPTQNFVEEELASAQLEILALREENRRLKEMKTKSVDDSDSNSSFVIQQYADKVSLLEREKEDLLRKVRNLELEVESMTSSSDPRYSAGVGRIASPAPAVLDDSPAPDLFFEENAMPEL